MRTLNRPGDFERVYKKGRVARTAALRLCYYYRGDDFPSRVAFVAGKRIGNAVRRNRVKRHLREGWRSLTPPATGYDFVWVPNARIADQSFLETKEGMVFLLQKATKLMKEST